MKKNIIILILVLGAVVSIVYLTTKESVPEEDVAGLVTQEARVLTVGDVIDSEPVVVFGQVVSADTVTVTPQVSGVITRISKTLGQTVRAGELVIELENSTEVQSVRQAQAQLSQAQAQLSKTTSIQPETVSNLESSLVQAKNAKQEQEQQLEITISTLKTDLESILENTINPLFTNEESVSRQFLPPTLTQLGEREVESGYDARKKEIDGFVFGNSSSTDEGLVVIENTVEYLQKMITLINTITVSENAPQETIDAWRNGLLGAKGTLEQRQGAIISQRTAISNAQETIDVAQNNLTQTEQSDNALDASIQESNVSIAQASVGQAQVQLERTRIKAPIVGRISEIETRVGQLVGPGSPVFTLSAAGALRVDAFVTENQASQISVGASVVINEDTTGTIARIAPSIDSETGKIKIEVLPDSNSLITEGTGVGISITTESRRIGFTLPIESFFVRGDESFVYVVQEGKTVPTAVKTQGLFGPSIIVTEGLNSGDQVISFARSFKDYQKVIIAN